MQDASGKGRTKARKGAELAPGRGRRGIVLLDSLGLQVQLQLVNLEEQRGRECKAGQGRPVPGAHWESCYHSHLRQQHHCAAEAGVAMVTGPQVPPPAWRTAVMSSDQHHGLSAHCFPPASGVGAPAASRFAPDACGPANGARGSDPGRTPGRENH